MKSIIAKENLILMQFIPIFLIFIYSTHRYTFRNLSHSVLGKLFAVFLVLYYTNVHFLYGTIACFVVIVYYMLTEVEGFAAKQETMVLESKVEEAKEEEKEEEKEKEEEEKEPTDTLVSSIITIDDFHRAKDQFIKEKCKNGILMYKDLPVKTEMADHVYSEIKFNKKTKCNPCDRTCDYNIVEAKLKTQEALTPKSNLRVQYKNGQK